MKNELMPDKFFISHAKLRTFLWLFVLLQSYTVYPAVSEQRRSLGKLTPERSSFDVVSYKIFLKVNPSQKFISGKNTIRFKMVQSTADISLDFSRDMDITSVLFRGNKIAFKRKGDVFKPMFGFDLLKDSLYDITVEFEGEPHVAEMPPWKGGFVWKKDNGANDWVGLACESLGPSAWLPCKDHWSDEADSVEMHLTVPEKLCGVSNGKLVSVSNADSGYKTYHWKTCNNINTYNISVNVGDYTLIRDTFYGINILPLDYYVLNYNRDKAEKHFLQVHGMLTAFENYFGAYPFPEDGYKLVETPYWGMEHQSCIAYGNNYRNNEFGFDFIIIHESGHEWFANSITAGDPADMWIHESFTTYSEALYLEYTVNKTRAVEYLLTQKKKIVGKRPVQGPRNVYYHNTKDADMYYKGTWMLHGMRSVLNNDSIWFGSLRQLSDSFRHEIIGSEDVILFLNRRTGYNWDAYFHHYLNRTHLPLLSIQASLPHDGVITYTLKLSRVANDFVIPLHFRYGETTHHITLHAGQTVEIKLSASADLYRYLNEYFLLEIRRGKSKDDGNR